MKTIEIDCDPTWITNFVILAVRRWLINHDDEQLNRWYLNDENKLCLTLRNEQLITLWALTWPNSNYRIVDSESLTRSIY
jgi:hypothetical protein